MSDAPAPRMILEVRSGTDAARTIVLEGPTPRTVGRGAAADERFPHDPYMNDLHAAFWVEGGACRVRDMGTTHGTWVNQQGVRETALSERDLIQVGGTLFALRVDRPVAVETRVERPAFANRAEQALWFLRAGGGQFYGVLDAARDEHVVPFLYGAGAQYQSLYEGLRGEELALVAPYLISLPTDAAALVELVEGHWGDAWGIFLRAEASFRDVRRHLRRLLRAELDDGVRVLFRFYDPRVLRAYLPTCTRDEADQMFGPIAHYITEGRRGETALRFARSVDGVSVETEVLAQDNRADQAQSPP